MSVHGVVHSDCTVPRKIAWALQRFLAFSACAAGKSGGLSRIVRKSRDIMLDLLDNFDLKILNLLQANGRINMSDLAARVGLSPSPCARRVKRLEDAGFVDRYVALLNPRKLGIGLLILVSVRLRSQTKEEFTQFEEEISKIPEILVCYLLTGSYDYLLQVRTDGIEEFKNFMRDRLTAIDGVIETHSSIVLDEIKSTTEIPLGKILNIS